MINESNKGLEYRTVIEGPELVIAAPLVLLIRVESPPLSLLSYHLKAGPSLSNTLSVLQSSKGYPQELYPYVRREGQKKSIYER
jgi:hypothetical protein